MKNLPGLILPFYLPINKLNSVCEGTNNVEGINKHYEKIMLDIYKANK